MVDFVKPQPYRYMFAHVGLKHATVAVAALASMLSVIKTKYIELDPPSTSNDSRIKIIDNKH